jgi:hypothetical protein
MSKGKEHRKRKRFQVPTGTYIALRPDYIKVGQIIDISVDGLAFDYVGHDKKSSTESRELDILMLDSAFHLYKIPCRIISDLKTYQSPPGFTISMRRCGVQFGGLTAYQSGRLKYFIKKHTKSKK